MPWRRTTLGAAPGTTRKAFFSETRDEQQARLTPDVIVETARRRGVFAVSWRRRDNWLRSRCRALVKAGRLRHVRAEPGTDYFEAT